MTMNTNETVEITDLEASNDDDIKGGPKKIFVGSLSVAPTEASDGVRDLLVFNANGSTT